MRDPKKYAMACACHWLNRCYDYGFTAEEVVARSVFRQMVSKRLDTQREGKEKEKFPPHPLIENKESQEKCVCVTACVRERVCAGARGDTPMPPTVEEVTEKPFKEFWKAYPDCAHKTAPVACRRAFQDLFKGIAGNPEAVQDLVTRIMRSLAEWKRSPDWKNEGGRYICSPFKFIQDRYWEVTNIRKESSNGNAMYTAHGCVRTNNNAYAPRDPTLEC